MNPRAMLRAAGSGLAAALPSCISSRGNPAENQAGRHGAVLTLGSFDLSESVLLAGIYGLAWSPEAACADGDTEAGAVA